MLGSRSGVGIMAVVIAFQFYEKNIYILINWRHNISYFPTWGQLQSSVNLETKF